MTPEAIGALIGTLIGALVTSIVGGVAVWRKIVNAVGVSAKNEEAIAKHTTELTRLHETVTALGESNDFLRKDNADKNVKIEELQVENKQKSAQLDQMRAQLNKADDRQRESEKAVAEMQGRLSEQRENADRQQVRLEGLIQSKVEESQRSAGLADELKIEREKYTALSLKTDAIQIKLDRAERDLSEEKTKRISLENEVIDLKLEVKQLKDIPAPVSAVVELSKTEAVIPPQEKN